MAFGHFAASCLIIPLSKFVNFNIIFLKNKSSNKKLKICAGSSRKNICLGKALSEGIKEVGRELHVDRRRFIEHLSRLGRNVHERD